MLSHEFFIFFKVIYNHLNFFSFFEVNHQATPVDSCIENKTSPRIDNVTEMYVVAILTIVSSDFRKKPNFYHISGLQNSTLKKVLLFSRKLKKIK